MVMYQHNTVMTLVLFLNMSNSPIFIKHGTEPSVLSLNIYIPIVFSFNEPYQLTLCPLPYEYSHFGQLRLQFIQFSLIMNIHDNLSHCVIVFNRLTNDDATLITRSFPCTQRRRYIFERTPPIQTRLCYISCLYLYSF